MTDPLNAHAAAQHMDIQDPAQLPQGIALSHGRSQESALDPVLYRMGFQAGDGGHLAQGNATSEKEGFQFLRNLFGLPAIRMQNRTGYGPHHFFTPFFLR